MIEANNGSSPSHELGQRIRTLRAQKGLTQSELAKCVGSSHVHIGRIEKGQSQPTADLVKRLAAALEVSGGYLLDGESNGTVVRFEDSEFSRRFQAVEKLNPEDREVVAKLIDAFLFKRHVQSMT